MSVPDKEIVKDDREGEEEHTVGYQHALDCVHHTNIALSIDWFAKPPQSKVLRFHGNDHVKSFAFVLCCPFWKALRAQQGVLGGDGWLLLPWRTRSERDARARPKGQ